MFLLHCAHCGRRELRGPRSLTTTDAGEFVAACRACGHEQHVAGGRPAVAPIVATPVTPTPATSPVAA
jgi:hypothetical protein